MNVAVSIKQEKFDELKKMANTCDSERKETIYYFSVKAFVPSGVILLKQNYANLVGNGRDKAYASCNKIFVSEELLK